MRFLRKERKRAGERGFSFIELVIVVAVVGILTAIAVPSYGAIQSNAKQAAVDSNANNGYKAIAAAQAGFGVSAASHQTSAASTATAPTPGSPAAVLAKLSTSGEVELKLIDKAGAELDTVTGDYCVWAYDAREELGEKWRYNSLVGDCPAVAPNRSGAVVAPEPEAPVEPSPEPTVPVEEPEPEIPANPKLSQWTLNCPVAVNSSGPARGITGTLTWFSNGEIISQETLTASSNPRALELEKDREYTVQVEGTFTHSANWLNNTTAKRNSACIRSMDLWGAESGTTSMEGAFRFGVNLTSVPANLPSTVTRLTGTFQDATKFNDSNVQKWDTKNVTDMGNTFLRAKEFSHDLSHWNVSQVINSAGFNNEAYKLTAAKSPFVTTS